MSEEWFRSGNRGTDSRDGILSTAHAICRVSGIGGHFRLGPRQSSQIQDRVFCLFRDRPCASFSVTEVCVRSPLVTKRRILSIIHVLHGFGAIVPLDVSFGTTNRRYCWNTSFNPEDVLMRLIAEKKRGKAKLAEKKRSKAKVGENHTDVGENHTDVGENHTDVGENHTKVEAKVVEAEVEAKVVEADVGEKVMEADVGEKVMEAEVDTKVVTYVATEDLLHIDETSQLTVPNGFSLDSFLDIGNIDDVWWSAT